MRATLLLPLMLCLVLAGLLPAFAQESAPVLSDAFANGAGDWEPAGGEWSTAGGRYLARSPKGDATVFATHRKAPILETQTVEATVSFTGRLAEGGWSVAGIALFFDPSNFWMLSLTDGPDGQRYVDFLENCAGTWQAQNEEGTTRLTGGAAGPRKPWTPGTDYRLRLSLDKDGIAALVKDGGTGDVVAEGRYTFGAAEAVRMGMAALLARGAAASFDDVRVLAPAGAGEMPAGIRVQKGRLGSIALLRDTLPGTDLDATDRVAGALRAAGFGVTPLTAEQAANPSALNPQAFALYVIPNAAVYPGNGARALMAYLRRGGHLMILGGPAFTHPVWRHQGEWVDREMIRARMAKQQAQRVFLDFEGDLPEWKRATNDPKIPSSAAKDAAGAAGTGHSLKVSTENLNGWNTFASPAQPGMFAAGHSLLCFWAKGDARTPQLSVEMNESDGSRWIATVPLTTEWTYHVLAPEEFHYWPDSKTKKTRGGSTDRFHPEDAERIVVGLAGTHTPAVGDGAHTFWIDQVGTAVNPYAGAAGTAEAFLPMETVTPSYKTYALEKTTTWVAAPGQTVLPAGFKVPAPASAYSAIVRPAGKGFGNERKWRWIPLIQALDAAGARRGFPAWLLLNQTPPFRDSLFAVFGVRDQKQMAGEPFLGAVVAAAKRMREGVFLSEAGATRFSYWPGEKVELGAAVRNRGSEAGAFTVRFTLSPRQGGKPLFQAEGPLSLAAGESKSVTRTWNPAGHDGGECQVVVELLRAGQVVDRIAHTLGFLSDAKPKPDDFVTVKNGDFWVNGRKWYPVGINYWALYVSGLEPSDYGGGWFNPAYYDPEEVERDLALMQKLGMNMVSIQMGPPEWQRNLLDFLRRCKRYGVRVNGFLGDASPIGFNEEKVAEYLRAGRLTENPVLFAYDTIWEPGNWMFRDDARGKWDPGWEAWIAERYGSLTAAEADWGMPAPRKDGKVTSPSDHQLREDGEWRVLVAAYRRFMDDLMSRKWNDATTALRRLDPNHLISFRQGNTLPHDFAFTATPKHTDFICPEGYSIPPGEKGYHAAGFITRYVDYTTHGKPIYWAEFGRSVWDNNRMEPDATAIQAQSEYNDLFYRVALDAGANATGPWWWPGGYRVNERSDYGIIHPDGTPRPAAQRIAHYSKRLQTPRERPKPDTWFVMDRDAHAGGYWWVSFNSGAEAYRKAHAEGKLLGVRSPGTGTTSCDVPLLAVGNRPYTGSNPPKYLNAEFNRLQVRDRAGKWVDVRNGAEIPVPAGRPVQLRAAVGNTQEATWLTPASAGGKPGAVFLATPAASGVQLRRPITTDTSYLSDADLGEFALAGVTAKTRVVLQMTAEGRAWFGEKREFTLAP